jgi:hypothetical protein
MRVGGGMSNPFLKHFEEYVLPDMMASHVSIAIITDLIDSKICLEVGASILLNKRILVVTTSNTLVSEKLRLVADKVLVIEGAWKSEAAKVMIQEAVTEVIELCKRGLPLK